MHNEITVAQHLRSGGSCDRRVSEPSFCIVARFYAEREREREKGRVPSPRRSSKKSAGQQNACTFAMCGSRSGEGARKLGFCPVLQFFFSFRLQPVALKRDRVIGSVGSAPMLCET